MTDDNEIDELINQLENLENPQPDPIPVEHNVHPEMLATPVFESHGTKPQLTVSNPDISAQEPTITAQPAIITHQAEVVPENPIDIKKYVQQLDLVTDEILQNVRNDRQEVTDYIILMRGRIEAAIAVGGDPPRMYVDNLGKALEVKTNISMTAVKAIEANAKMLAAMKPSTTIKNNTLINNSSNTDSQLLELLSTPLGEEDDV